MSIIENFKNLDPKTIMITVGIFAMIGGIDTNVNSEAWAERQMGRDISRI